MTRVFFAGHRAVGTEGNDVGAGHGRQAPRVMVGVGVHAPTEVHEADAINAEARCNRARR